MWKIVNSSKNVPTVITGPLIRQRPFTLSMRKRGPDWVLQAIIPNSFPVVGDGCNTAFAVL